MDARIILMIGAVLNVIGYAASMLGYAIIGPIVYGVGIIVLVLSALTLSKGKSTESNEAPGEPGPSDIKNRGIRKPGEEY
ncbi:hypothetical protein [Caldivirga sp. UBA161]|uniref:hypothetical protein n=1 Tax=Caldivirga sp. UBA161 TaxID=1915569 RepID=UPI0025BCA433|nr:hypothetical protein [Caldivirga sp. UBA161]